MNIGKKLQEFRNKNNLSQDEVSEKLNITRQTLSNWENNKSYPDILYIIELSEIYNISLDELIKSDTNMIKHIKDNVDTVKSNEKVSRRLLINTYLKIIAIGFMILTIVFLIGNIQKLNSDITNLRTEIDNTAPIYTKNNLVGLYSAKDSNEDVEIEETTNSKDYNLYLGEDGRYIYNEITYNKSQTIEEKGHIGNYDVVDTKIILNHLYSFDKSTKKEDYNKTEIPLLKEGKNYTNILSHTSLDGKKLRMMLDGTPENINDYLNNNKNSFNHYLNYPNTK